MTTNTMPTTMTMTTPKAMRTMPVVMVMLLMLKVLGNQTRSTIVHKLNHNVGCVLKHGVLEEWRSLLG